MTNILVSLVDGQPVLIEVDETRVTRSIAGDVIAPVGKVADALDSAKDTILRVAKKMVTAVRETDQAITPDEFELTFSLKFTTEGQAVIAKVGGEASFSVKMTYRHKTDSGAH